MTTLREAAQQALEALEMLAQPTKTNNETPRYKAHKAAITALRAALEHQQQEPAKPTVQEMQNAAANLKLMKEMFGDSAALAQQEQEPVAWMAPNGELRKDRTPRKFSDWGWGQEDYVPLYTAPPRREWKVLTNEELNRIESQARSHDGLNLSFLFLEIQQALKEKNNG